MTVMPNALRRLSRHGQVDNPIRRPSRARRRCAGSGSGGTQDVVTAQSLDAVELLAQSGLPRCQRDLFAGRSDPWPPRQFAVEVHAGPSAAGRMPARR